MKSMSHSIPCHRRSRRSRSRRSRSRSRRRRSHSRCSASLQPLGPALVLTRRSKERMMMQVTRQPSIQVQQLAMSRDPRPGRRTWQCTVLQGTRSVRWMRIRGSRVTAARRTSAKMKSAPACSPAAFATLISARRARPPFRPSPALPAALLTACLLFLRAHRRRPLALQ